MTTPLPYVCVHGHFYQPPRENPWLEAIELQESAEPFHDWNERITAECYRPNCASRIQSPDGHILGIINNYAHMSFNFGATLLSWLESHSTKTYDAILAADRESLTRFDGHGSAIAQVYNHIIMPLANERDQDTQVVWGIRDFEHRFGRKPEGMWLAEAAVNTESLETLARHGIAFTILAPRQAKAVRPIADNREEVPEAGWEDVSNGRVDPTRPYVCYLPSGRKITLFFYDGPISQAVAFEGILQSGERFGERILTGQSQVNNDAQLIHIATDGETYGHHHRHGDMALAYAMHWLETKGLARITNYSQYLALHPPTWEVRIQENSSWSCAHGVERWASDCGCSSGQHHGWSQQWRAPLREALDWLRDTVNEQFEAVAGELFSAPWAARNAYVDVLLDRRPETMRAFLSEQTARELSDEERKNALRLMEMQRQLLLMYTSCGWFFDELSGLETVQILQYAGRAIELAELTLGVSLEDEFTEILAKANSNVPEHVNGRNIYNRFVRPARVDLQAIAAHYAVKRLFNGSGPLDSVYKFLVRDDQWERQEAGQVNLVTGTVSITDPTIVAQEKFMFAALHLGGSNVTIGALSIKEPIEADAALRGMRKAFDEGDFAQVLRQIDQAFPGQDITLASLLRDQKQRILGQIVGESLNRLTPQLQQIHEDTALLLQFLVKVDNPQPQILREIGRFVVAREVRDLLAEESPDIAKLMQLTLRIAELNLPIRPKDVEISLNDAIARQVHLLAANPTDMTSMETLLALTKVASCLPFPVTFWQAQNAIYRLMRTTYPQQKLMASHKEGRAVKWVGLYRELAESLKVNVEDAEDDEGGGSVENNNNINF